MKRLLALVFCFVVVFSSLAFSQIEEATFSYNMYDFSFYGGGARAAGMGNAFIAVSDDITGGSWNPAGLHTFEQATISATYSSVIPRGNTVTTIFNTDEFSHSGSINNITALNFAAPLRVKGHPFVFSLNFSQNFDVYESYNSSASLPIPYTYNTAIGEVTDTLDLVQNILGSAEGGMYSWNFSFGTRLYKKISFGAAINIYTGRVDQINDRHTTTYDFPYIVGQVTQRATLDQFITVDDTIKFSGVNLTLGFKYNGDKTNYGMVIRTPYELKTERDNQIYVITMLNNQVRDEGTDTTYFTDLVTKYQMPWIIGLGVERQLSENFKVAADFDMSFFKGRHVLFRESVTIQPGSSNLETFDEIDPEWENSFGFRVGTEYLKETKYGTVPLRAGIGIQPVPDPEISLAGDTTVVSNINFALGTGIHWNQIKLDVAYTYNYKNRSSYSQAPIDETGTNYIDIDQETKDKIHGLRFSFTGVF